MRRELICMLLVAVAGVAPVRAQQKYKYPFQNPNLPAEKRIDNILSLMTIDEKIDALGVQTGVTRLGIPSYGGSEGIHGVVQRGYPSRHMARITTTQFPQPPGMGETWNPGLVEQAGEVEGYEARFISQTKKYHRHILMLWGPQLNLARDPRWGRLEEVYGEDPFLTGTMGVAFIHGLQGPNPKYWLAASLMKHFMGYSREKGRNNSYSNFDERLFWEYYSVAFRMGFVEGGSRGVMASYNAWQGKPMDINPVLRSLVIDKWGADVVSTDGGAVANMVKYFKIFPTQQQAVVACLRAGINQFLDKYKEQVKAALKDGEISEAQIDALLRPKYRVTLKLGLLDPPSMVPYAKIKDSPEPWNTPHDRNISREMALESVVLLKDRHHFLPLNKAKVKSIAVIGPLANSVHWDWYGGIPPYAVTPLEGIKSEAGPGVTVNYAKDNTDDAAVKAARESDVAVVVVGNDPTCGPNMAHEWNKDGSTKPCPYPSEGREGRDRTSITLEQEALVKQVYAANPKTVLILVSSFPYAIHWSEEHVPGILHMAHSSQDEGTALAKVLFGDYDPGGHLVETWPRSLDQVPPMTDYNIRDGRTYMYFRGKPLYPFGYGLTYTKFRYAHMKLSAKQLARDGEVTVSVEVTNTGKRVGDAVVQLYVAYPKSKVQRPREQLVGFKRVTVVPDESATVRIPLKASQLAYWDVTEKGFVVEATPVTLLIGDSSADIKRSKTIPAM
ncbi:MAG TPA: glycoside hydrolase family 3 C-terminal domain-containing protein [Acidobacteriaceae bacterium]|nr:glycoside hydrolase family 3 C-terminal domain-containing protein [Acidobacteriaceae bacterium]